MESGPPKRDENLNIFFSEEQAESTNHHREEQPYLKGNAFMHEITLKKATAASRELFKTAEGRERMAMVPLIFCSAAGHKDSGTRRRRLQEPNGTLFMLVHSRSAAEIPRAAMVPGNYQRKHIYSKCPPRRLTICVL
jgi:hypothetical protein